MSSVCVCACVRAWRTLGVLWGADKTQKPEGTSDKQGVFSHSRVSHRHSSKASYISSLQRSYNVDPARWKISPCSAERSACPLAVLGIAVLLVDRFAVHRRVHS
jgi:hypothetical protein